jgi:hypothetical protein
MFPTELRQTTDAIGIGVVKQFQGVRRVARLLPRGGGIDDGWEVSTFVDARHGLGTNFQTAMITIIRR